MSNCEIQPFDKGCFQFRGILGISKHLLQSPVNTDYCSSLDHNNAIIPSSFDDLAIQTRWSKDTADGLCIKGKSVCGDQRDAFQIRSVGDIPDEAECVSLASPSYNC